MKSAVRTTDTNARSVRIGQTDPECPEATCQATSSALARASARTNELIDQKTSAHVRPTKRMLRARVSEIDSSQANSS